MASLERRVAIDAARAAGQLLRDARAGIRSIAYKGAPTNLVTEMDARAEAMVLEHIRTAFPDDAVLAEESGARPGTSGRRWIIDPLDGTTNYAHGVPIWAVSIALEGAGGVQLGVVFDPCHDELFVAERGGGATLNGAPLAVSGAAILDESLLATGFPYGIRETSDTNLAEYAAFCLRSRGVRRMGSAVPISRGWPPAGSMTTGSCGSGRGMPRRGRSWWTRREGRSAISPAAASISRRRRSWPATAASTTPSSRCCTRSDRVEYMGASGRPP